MNIRERDAAINMRFDALVAVEVGSDCHWWEGTVNEAGYGRFWLGRSSSPYRISAHRFAWERAGGTVPDGLTLDHLCRNRLCVNPAHLELVTNRENVLRGVTHPSRNAAKEACPKGHGYTVKADGSRYCMECNRERQRRHYRDHADEERQKARERRAARGPGRKATRAQLLAALDALVEVVAPPHESSYHRSMMPTCPTCAAIKAAKEATGWVLPRPSRRHRPRVREGDTMSGPPWKCPECGVWWAGLEHRCQENIFRTMTSPGTVLWPECNCVYDDHGLRVPQTAPCPTHDYTDTIVIRATGWNTP